MAADQPIVHQDAGAGHVPNHIVAGVDALGVGDEDTRDLLVVITCSVQTVFETELPCVCREPVLVK